MISNKRASVLFVTVVMILTFAFAACGYNNIPDLESASRYSEEELRKLSEETDEQTLMKNWGEPHIVNNERLWSVELTGETKYMVAYVENGKIISLTLSKTMFITVVRVEAGVTYCTYGWDDYSSDSSYLAFMPTQDIFGNAINCEVGDQILFETDGMVAETYPAQLAYPYSFRVMGHLSDEELQELNIDFDRVIVEQ